VAGVAVLALPVWADDPAPGRQVEQALTTSTGYSIPYLLYLPEGEVPEGGHPLILFLHGRGESDGPLSVVAKWGPPRMAARGEGLPYIVVSPQCPRETNWSAPEQQAAVLELLEHVLASQRSDRNRVYLTGLSMGGYGTWRLAAAHPDKFAAAAPVCGGGRVEDAAALTKLPIWAFHGTEDEAVPLRRSEEMVEAIEAAGGVAVRFTTLEHVGHNSWSAAYATPELYQWLNQHSLPR
jgi:predicted peptidase